MGVLVALLVVFIIVFIRRRRNRDKSGDANTAGICSGERNTGIEMVEVYINVQYIIRTQ